MPPLPLRGEVPTEPTWNLEDIHASPEACTADLEAVMADLPSAGRYRGLLGEDAPTLLGCLRLRDRLEQVAWKALYFARNRLAEDRRDALRQGLADRALAVWNEVVAAFAFLPGELGGLPEAAFDGFVAHEPALAPYRRHLADMRADRDHRLSPEAERALAAVGGLAEA